MHVEILVGLPIIYIYVKMSIAVPKFDRRRSYEIFFEHRKSVPLKNNFYLQIWYIQVNKNHVLTTI